MSEEQEEPRGSQVKYRLQFRNRNGLQGREAMIVCQNFSVNRFKMVVYVDLQGNFKTIELRSGDYFDVKVMGS